MKHEVVTKIEIWIFWRNDLWYVKRLQVHTESRSLDSPASRRNTFYMFDGRHVAIIFMVTFIIFIIAIVLVLVVGAGVIGGAVDIVIVVICHYMVYLHTFW